MFNRKVLFSVLTIGMFTIAAGAGTWACFQGVQSSNNNDIKTGHITLEIVNNFYSEPAVVPMTVSNLKPGETKALTPIPFEVTNTGSHKGRLYAKISPIDRDNALSQYLVINAIMDTSRGESYTLWDKTNDVGFMELGELDGGQTRNVYFNCNFEESKSPQNEAQGKPFNFKVTFRLQQV